jgi:hypothetical protein
MQNGRIKGELGGCMECRQQRIETTIAGTSKHNSSALYVLDQKEETMKLNKDMIIKSESMNGKKIFRCTGNI